MNAKLRIALGAPLVGLVLTWSLWFIASYVQAAFFTGYDSRNALHWNVYLYLAGIAVFAGASVFAFRVADSEVAESRTLSSVAVLKFAGFGVIVAAAAGAVYALTLFFNSVSSDSPNKLLETYVPIVLVAGVVVVAILQATAWRKSQSEPGAPADPRKRALALAWTLPIIGSALALIIGLVAYSGTTNVSIWVLVVTLSIIMVSVLIGTHFAAIARGLVKREVRENTVEVGGGASKLNFVLAVVFGAAVNAIAFGMGMSAASNLFSYTYSNDGTPLSSGIQMTSDWWGNQFAPSLVFLLLAQAIVYFSVTMRHRTAE